MKSDYETTDERIRASMKLTDVPSPQLNQRLKAALYEQEAALEKKHAARALSLWYLPMLFNFAVFGMLAAAAWMAISNVYLACFAAGCCLYIGLAGVLLTVLGVKRANLKENMELHVEKRGVWI